MYHRTWQVPARFRTILVWYGTLLTVPPVSFSTRVARSVQAAPSGEVCTTTIQLPGSDEVRT